MKNAFVTVAYTDTRTARNTMHTIETRLLPELMRRYGLTAADFTYLELNGQRYKPSEQNINKLLAGIEQKWGD